MFTILGNTSHQGVSAAVEAAAWPGWECRTAGLVPAAGQQEGAQLHMDYRG